jgi:hypothetical protein
VRRERARPAPFAGWGAVAGRRFGAFTLALVCGVGVPLSPLAAEYFVTGDIVSGSWSAVGVTYVAGVALVSRSHTILVGLLLLASVMAFIYGVDLKDAYDHIQAHGVTPQSPGAVAFIKWMIGVASMLYIGERAGRHLLDDKSFLET